MSSSSFEVSKPPTNTTITNTVTLNSDPKNKILSLNIFNQCLSVCVSIQYNESQYGLMLFG